ncbi:MAG: sulfotransferase domain-containing protein, partial [Cyanobacteria bacterium J06621_12]
HEYFDPRYQKVILVVRDPRDVTLSSYFHALKYGLITETTSLEEFCQKFLLGQYYFVGEPNPLGSWSENTGSWLGARKNDANFLLLRYEDFQTNIVEQLNKIANFMSLKCSDSDIAKAVKNSSIEHMRKLEQQQKNVWPNKYTKKDIAFVRSAVSGKGQVQLSPSVLKQIELLWGETMEKLGYL